MDAALEEARRALDHATCRSARWSCDADDGAVVARRHNEREAAADPTAHAEVLALRDAAAAAGTWRLDGHALVVTLEPCPMCAGAALAARIGMVAFGAPDPKAGAIGSLYNLGADPRLNHEFPVVPACAPTNAGPCSASSSRRAVPAPALRTSCRRSGPGRMSCR